MVDIDELLRIAANDWEPRALNLNHDLVTFEKTMALVAQIEFDFGDLTRHHRFRFTGTDADWIVKLIDVYPPSAEDNSPRGKQVKMGDYQMLLAAEVFRGKAGWQ